MHVALPELALAIIIATVCVFFASFIIWMLLPYHKADIKFMPNEDDFSEAISKLDIKPGLYMYPNCQTAEQMKSDEFKDRFNKGPWGMITIMGAKPNFMMNLIKTFIAYLVITIIVAYITSVALPAGTEYLKVFQVAGAAAFLGHCTGSLAGDIFLGKPTRFIITSFIDGLIFALITAGIFASMWPALEAAIEGSPLMVTPGG
jgi:hypothetical protein